MAFHVVSSFLLRVLASKTTLWMAGIFQQPIRCFYFMVFEANTHSKKEDTTWKAMKSWVRKCYIFLCTINFEVTWPFWKMWSLNEFFYQSLQVASYIPQLAKYSANSFGVSICTVDGQRFSIGDTNVPFTLQVLFPMQLFYTTVPPCCWLFFLPHTR